MNKPVAEMTTEEAQAAFKRATNDYMTLPCGLDAPPKQYAKWKAALALRNEIYRHFGDQVLTWARS